MDTLSDLIRVLNSKDLDDFKGFLKRKNKRDDVKNIALIDFLKTDDINVKKRLYASAKNNDAYHALRKRLQDNVLLYLSQKTFETNNSAMHEALRLLVVARFLLEQDLAKIAFKCLDKGERLAEKLEQFTLLHDILLLKLQYAHLLDGNHLEELTEKFLANQADMQKEAKLNLAYAFLRQELQEINLKGKVINLTSLIVSTVRKYKIAFSDLMTYKSLYQIMYIANEYAAIYQNYGLIERFINRSYQFVQSQSQRNSAHLFYHISIVYYLANFHLRSKDFALSESYLDEMNGLMGEEKQYKTLFFMREQLLLALNKHFSGSGAEAIAILRNALEQVHKKTKPEDVADLRLCLAMFLAQHHDRTALKQLALLAHTDAWYEKKLGMLWTIRKNLMEILVQAQFEQIEIAMSRLTSFKRRYKHYLNQTREERVLNFLTLVEHYLVQPAIVFEKSYQSKVLAMLTVKENQDIFNLSFIGWLIALWKKKTSYDTTLRLIQESKANKVQQK